MTKENIHVKGKVSLTLRNAFDEIVEVRDAENLITNAGFDFICDVMGNPTQPNDMGWIAVGSGVTPANVTDTALEHELGRVANTYSHTPGTKTYTASGTFASGVATGPITEAGLVNASTGGTLLNRQTFDVINKGANDSLEVKWTLTLS